MSSNLTSGTSPFLRDPGRATSWGAVAGLALQVATLDMRAVGSRFKRLRTPAMRWMNSAAEMGWPRDRLPGMPGEALLIGIATIAVVVAGFTAVTSTLVPPGGSWQPAMRIRQRAIVSTSFNVMFESLAPLIAFAWLADARVAIVVASAGVAVYATGIVIWRGRQLLRAGGNRTRTGWCCTRSDRQRRCCSGRTRSCSVRWPSTPSPCASSSRSRP